MARFLTARGRAVAVVNLDPANDRLPYPVDIDVSELVNLAVCSAFCRPGGMEGCSGEELRWWERTRLEWIKSPISPSPLPSSFSFSKDVMETQNLGPNGGLVYCMEYLEQNLDWLFQRLEALEGKRYVLFDFPGQVRVWVLWVV